MTRPTTADIVERAAAIFARSLRLSDPITGWATMELLCINAHHVIAEREPFLSALSGEEFAEFVELRRLAFTVQSVRYSYAYKAAPLPRDQITMGDAMQIALMSPEEARKDQEECAKDLFVALGSDRIGRILDRIRTPSTI